MYVAGQNKNILAIEHWYRKFYLWTKKGEVINRFHVIMSEAGTVANLSCFYHYSLDGSGRVGVPGDLCYC